MRIASACVPTRNMYMFRAPMEELLGLLSLVFLSNRREGISLLAVRVPSLSL